MEQEEKAARVKAAEERRRAVVERLRKAEEEEPVGIAIADHVVVNDDLELTLQELLRVLHHERNRRTIR